MKTWSSSLLTKVEKHLHSHEYWGKWSHLDSEEPNRPHKIHLAVFVEPFLTFVLEGRKTVESRFSIHRRPPFGCVRSGDLVLIKESGGPIVAMAEVSRVWYYQLDPGRNLGKTNPLNDEDMAEFVKLQKTFADSPKSWSVDAKSIDRTTFDLSVKNPNGGEDISHRSPLKILEEIAALDAESAEVLGNIKALL